MTDLAQKLVKPLIIKLYQKKKKKIMLDSPVYDLFFRAVSVVYPQALILRCISIYVLRHMHRQVWDRYRGVA